MGSHSAVELMRVVRECNNEFHFSREVPPPSVPHMGLRGGTSPSETRVGPPGIVSGLHAHPFIPRESFGPRFFRHRHCDLGECLRPDDARHIVLPSVVDTDKAMRLLRNRMVPPPFEAAGPDDHVDVAVLSSSNEWDEDHSRAGGAPAPATAWSSTSSWDNRTSLVCWHGSHSRYGYFQPGDFVSNTYVAANETVRPGLLELRGKHGNAAKVGGMVGIAGFARLNGRDCKYCLCPKGLSAYTSRLYESFFSGCIPVLLSDDFEPPFPREIVWDRAALWLPHGLPPQKLLDTVLKHRRTDLVLSDRTPRGDDSSPTGRPLAVFTYGTLRADYSAQGDRWGVLQRFKGLSWQRARVEGFGLYQDVGVDYPFVAPTTSSGAEVESRVFGTILSSPNETLFRDVLAECDRIEGYPHLYKRKIVRAEIVGEERIPQSVEAFIYYQVAIFFLSNKQSDQTCLHHDVP